MEIFMMLLEQLSKHYGMEFMDIQLLRDWIGQVYIVNTADSRYILKIFRKEYQEAAIQSAAAMIFLKKNSFTVPAIMLTENGDYYFLTKKDNQVAILYEYIEGKEPDCKSNLEAIGRLTGLMRKTMEQYTGEIQHKNKDYFINRYISILAKKKFEGIDQFEEHGNRLWNRVRDNFLGFCHGDMHTGNMIMRNQEIVYFDFDACGIAHPLYDIATLCDETDYFDLSDENFKSGITKTTNNLDIFLKGYKEYYILSEAEKRAIYNFIAIRHYDIQATIIESQGLNCVDNDFLADQYRWLMKWEHTCNSNELGMNIQLDN